MAKKQTTSLYKHNIRQGEAGSCLPAKGFNFAGATAPNLYLIFQKYSSL
jgi:hypothetical protein